MEKMKQVLGVIIMIITILITAGAAIIGIKEYRADKARARQREFEMRRERRRERREARRAARA